MNRRLNEELADFLAKRGQYEEDVEVYPSPTPQVEENVKRVYGQAFAHRLDREMVDAYREQAERGLYASAGLPPPSPPLPKGDKHDSGKAPLSWLGQVSRALADVARSLAHGAEKYAPDNWRHVPAGSRRYRDAALRHLMADLRGERMDREQGLPHVTIAALNLLMAAEHDLGFEQDGERVDHRNPLSKCDCEICRRTARPPG